MTFKNCSKVLSLCLVLMFALAACSGGTGTATQATTQAAATAATTAATTAAVQEPPAKLVLFYPFQSATSTPEGMDAVRAELEKQMAEDLNVTLDWIIIPRDGFEEKKNTLLASGDQLDGFIGDTDDFGVDISKPGLVAPIGALVEQYGQNIRKMMPEDAWINVKNPSGEILGIPSYERVYWNGAIIRQDWLEDAGLEMPTTVEEFETVLAAFKDRGDVVPVAGKPWFLEPSMASAISGGVTAETGWETESPEGVFIQAYEHPDYVKFLEMYRRWLDNGWYDPDFLVTDESQYDQWLITGKVGVLFTDPRNIDRYQPQLTAQDPDGKLEIMPVLSGPMGDAALPENSGAGMIAYVTTMSKHPELVVKYFDWLAANRENYILGKYGIDGANYVRDGEDGWKLPDSAGGDESKRGYDTVYMPLSYEGYALKRTDLSYDVEATQDYYRSLPMFVNPLKGFVIDWEKVGDFNSIDIWVENYNIAAGVRPISEWQAMVDEYEASVEGPYAEIRRQHEEWKAANGR
ncbi:MAG: extracellular solute-binding protein [Clostridiales bacterium]|nr:extracellular solute-binding protein [Clostridiales bacterium]